MAAVGCFSTGDSQDESPAVDYAGPESCEPCHAENYAGWYQHAHRRMNALADPDSVEGYFSGGERSRIDYMGGVSTFFSSTIWYI